MNTSPLRGQRVAFLATHGFEQSELIEPRRTLQEAGAHVDVVSLEPFGTKLDAFHHRDKVGTVAVDRILSEARANDYHALVIPGGLHSPDSLRVDVGALQFVEDFFSGNKPVGAICHGPQVLISAGVVEGRTMTAVKSIQLDLRNAGAHVLDAEVVVDGNLVTSRTPADLPAFCPALVEILTEAHAQVRQAA